MPAYFSIYFKTKDDINNKDVMKNFYTKLTECGLRFKSGFWHSEDNTLEEILVWNQKKIDEKYQLGFTEHYSHDYKQMLLDFHDFSEVRLIVAYSETNSSALFYIIIPEDDFLEYNNKNDNFEIVRRYDKMNIIKKLAVNMWNTGDIDFVQTGWECSDVATTLNDIKAGKEPLTEPFSILSKDLYNAAWTCGTTILDNGGIMLNKENNWCYL